jgi:TPR repeat protein
LSTAAVSADHSSLALLYASKACLRGDARGCTALGVQALTGQGTRKDLGRAEKLFAYACDEGETRACALFAWLQLQTDQAPQVRRLLAAQCTAERRSGCAGLGLLMESGVGGERDMGTALAAYLAGCDSGDSAACVFGGVLIEEHSRVYEHERRARALFETGCAAPVGEPCWIQASSDSPWRRHFRGESFDRRACDGLQSRALSCYNAALGYERGTGGAVDGQRAQELFDQSCAQGFARACRRASAFVLY